MTLYEMRTKFRQAMQPLYGAEETDSFFRLVLEFRHGMSRADLALRPDTLLTEEDVVFWEEVMAALSVHRPIQYILGETTFFGRRFHVGPDVLIPRPETEELVAWMVSDIDPRSRILDIGTGSGAIALTLALELPSSRVTALDVSDAALSVASGNARSLGAQVVFCQTDILRAETLDTFDVIVSNPPYVRQLEKAEMNPNVLSYEPHLALFVEDADPLLFYRRIASLARGALAPGGWLYFEINQYFGKETADVLIQAGFEDVTLRQDIFGNDRMIRGRKPYS